MGVEIEHKFLVDTRLWTPSGSGSMVTQGYLSTDPNRVVRVRVVHTQGFITIKGKALGPSRSEFEYEIPVLDAMQMIQTLCESTIQKRRYIEMVGKHRWEIDVFEGANAGLVLAEIEISEEGETFERPAWLGEDVTTDYRYSNSALIEKPFLEWPL